MEILKKNNLLITAIGIFILFTSCNEGKNQEDIREEDGEEKVMMAGYMDIKNALFNDNPDEVQNKAREIIESEELADETELQVDAMANSSDIEEQRKHFANLSEELYLIVKNNGTGKTLYISHCPMALDGEGANWLSYEEKISNPYMGQKMPECGSVQETIN